MKFLKKFDEASKRFTLDGKIKDKVSKLADDLFNEVKKYKNRKYLFQKVDIWTIDGTIFSIPVYIDPNYKTGQAGVTNLKDYKTKERMYSPNNLCLIINPSYVTSRKELYNTLYHEFLHIVDPQLTSKRSDKYMSKYGLDDEKYFAHGVELRGITGEFLEALTNEYKERLEYCEDEQDLEILSKSLKSIIGFFNELELPSPLAYDILNKMSGIIESGLRPLSNMFRDYPKTSELREGIPDREPEYLIWIDKIRQYSPKGWKMFMSMLYSTSQEIKEMIELRKNELIEST